MKVISVRQPWAHAIVHLGKDVENRTKNVAGDYRGPLAIQVSTGAVDQFSYQEILRITGQPLSNPLWLGYIIGVVDLVDVHRWPCPGGGACSVWAECVQVQSRRGGRLVGMTHLVLENPRPLQYPMWVLGHLGLWDVADELILPRLEVADRG